MASLITHAVVAVALGQAEPPPVGSTLRFWLAALFCSLVPDLDVLGFHFGVHYGDLWGHRGLTHSLIFALGLGCLMSLRFYGKPGARLSRLAVLFTLITASHGLLDALTNGGLGVAFFSPWDSHRYFLPWRPVLVSPISLQAFLTPRGIRILQSEILWIWAPVLFLGVTLNMFRHFRGGSKE